MPAPASVLVAGSGVMGAGIAAAFLRSGARVQVLSRAPERVPEKVAGATGVGQLPDAAPELIVESVPEKLDLKKRLYADIEARYGGRPIVATNTSGLPLEELAAGLRHKGRFLGLHYFMPADVMPIVEVIRTQETEDAAIETVIAGVRACGQNPLVLKRPIEGFVINRLQHAILHEAYYLIEQGICGPEEIDQAAREMFGPRMCVTGLLEQKDLSGLDTHALVQRAIVPHLNHSAEPSRIVQDLYARGDIGVKSGRGFYDWSKRDPRKRQAEARARLAEILALLARQVKRNAGAA
jgi:3-hydroxybutyryl-CoA dehydrogenase